MLQKVWYKNMILSRKKIKVAVVYNKPITKGNNDKDNISYSAVFQEAEAVYNSLIDLKQQVEYFPIDNIIEDLVQLNLYQPDVIFNLCEGYREKSYFELHMAALWELLKIPYTGNPPLTLGISLNKVLTKKLLESKRIPTPMYQIYRQIPEKTYLSFPLIAKPSCEDASLGITQDSVVNDFEQMCEIVKILLEKYKQPVLLEKYIEGREFNVSILGNNPPKILAISEIDFSQVDKKFYPITSYEAKWLTDHPLYHKTPAICPAKISDELESKLKDTALRVYALLGGRDYGRVDMRVTSSGAIYVLEFNPNPDISLDAGYAKAIKTAKMTYNQFINFILHEALNRKTYD